MEQRKEMVATGRKVSSLLMGTGGKVSSLLMGTDWYSQNSHWCSRSYNVMDDYARVHGADWLEQAGRLIG
jgi:hypothetical protein